MYIQESNMRSGNKVSIRVPNLDLESPQFSPQKQYVDRNRNFQENIAQYYPE